MALTLFTRRPEPVDLPAVEPEPWPEIGETWTPEGVTIAQRYYNQAHAVVLVFTTDDGKYGTYYSIACLGCHYATRENGERTYNTRYGCRRRNGRQRARHDLPGAAPRHPRPPGRRHRPRAAALLGARRPPQGQGRPALPVLPGSDPPHPPAQQRLDRGPLQQLAADEPDVLRTERSEYSDYVSYYARQLPES
ncbi:hypothetical protein [Streptomyces sp. NPDC054849]